jgi:hypothetical protein
MIVEIVYFDKSKREDARRRIIADLSDSLSGLGEVARKGCWKN